MKLTEAKKFLSENDVKFVLAQFVDIHGVAKTKAVPAGHLEDIVTDGAGFAGFAVWGLAQEPHSPDFMAKADLSTLSLVPWQPGFARVVCVGHVNDQPYEYDSRHVLQKQIARLTDRGASVRRFSYAAARNRSRPGRRRSQPVCQARKSGCSAEVYHYSRRPVS